MKKLMLVIVMGIITIGIGLIVGKDLPKPNFKLVGEGVIKNIQLLNSGFATPKITVVFFESGNYVTMDYDFYNVRIGEKVEIYYNQNDTLVRQASDRYLIKEIK
jgi:hypothetical protein